MADTHRLCKIIYHPKYGLYNLGSGHPFNPLRTEMVLDLLNEFNMPAETELPEPLAPGDILTIHDKEYVDVIEALSRGEKTDGVEKFGLGTLDNPVTVGMAEGARYQCGGTLLGARMLLENKAGKVLQMGGGFHHARRALAEGFCIYNDLALAIKEMTNAGLYVAYIDIDVHHGDGVQEIFYSDDKVMTVSFHESGEYLFPGTGWIHELGQGMGRSLKLNLPLEPFTEGDSFFEIMDGILQPALSWFKPDVLVIQAGADAHFTDPLADLMLTTHDYQKIFKYLIGLADNFTDGKALFTLGGGYSITAAPRIWTVLYSTLLNIVVPDLLPDKWRNKWGKITEKEMPLYLHDREPAFEPVPRKKEIEKRNRDFLRRLKDAVVQDWI